MLVLKCLFVPFYYNSSKDQKGPIRIFSFLRRIKGFVFRYGIFFIVLKYQSTSENQKVNLRTLWYQRNL